MEVIVGKFSTVSITSLPPAMGPNDGLADEMRTLLIAQRDRHVTGHGSGRNDGGERARARRGVGHGDGAWDEAAGEFAEEDAQRLGRLQPVELEHRQHHCQPAGDHTRGRSELHRRRGDEVLVADRRADGVDGAVDQDVELRGAREGRCHKLEARREAWLRGEQDALDRGLPRAEGDDQVGGGVVGQRREADDGQDDHGPALRRRGVGAHRLDEGPARVVVHERDLRLADHEAGWPRALRLWGCDRDGGHVGVGIQELLALHA
eukprot:133321-Rhodomonas_salina.3